MATDRLVTVEWARLQLGHAHGRSTRRWLDRHGIRVVSGRFPESAFYGVWRPAQAFDAGAAVEEALRS